MNKIINGVANDFEFDGIETFNRWQDPTINNLQQQLDKYKSTIDKIKEYITVDYNDYKYLIDKDNIIDLNESFWQGVVITSRDILELLKEVE